MDSEKPINLFEIKRTGYLIIYFNLQIFFYQFVSNL